jgi:hypothetical protein
MLKTEAGQAIDVRDAYGETLRRVAAGPVDPGYDFAVVWACRPEEWDAAHSEHRDPECVPWPIEDVTIVESVPA